ncbi:MAG TPA: leucyl/phenylalanyl-tRNA--protein transferase [Jiangellaceae bacterium]|nr:leucyl/phenylalanyl-tRNA--protein transferase [Jiangellaceae bacterium]
MPPVEPPPTPWILPDADRSDPDGLVAVGADLGPGTLLAAYRRGLFPMPLTRADLGWWSPDPRGVLPLAGLHVSRSLRRARRRFEIRVDTAFDEVVAACADHRRRGGWITPAVARAYGELHRLGWAHSVESWTPDGLLAGGLYGVAIGGLFAGESMFHAPQAFGRDASKVALAALVEVLGAAGHEEERLVDVQWTTPHLRSLGVIAVTRAEYLDRLRTALALPLPTPFGDALS